MESSLRWHRGTSRERRVVPLTATTGEFSRRAATPPLRISVRPRIVCWWQPMATLRVRQI